MFITGVFSTRLFYRRYDHIPEVLSVFVLELGGVSPKLEKVKNFPWGYRVNSNRSHYCSGVHTVHWTMCQIILTGSYNESSTPTDLSYALTFSPVIAKVGIFVQWVAALVCVGTFVSLRGT